MPLNIVNATIKLGSDLIPGAIVIGDDKMVMFLGCNISGGAIESYHHPLFKNCFLQNVVADSSSPSREGDGPVFTSCRLENMKVPHESGFVECKGDGPKYSWRNG